MKLYLDDVRPTPQSWERVYTARECIEFLQKHWDEITHVSLDHDLGHDESVVGTGYDVVNWIEELVHSDTPPGKMPKITVHSSNAPARARMESGINAIQNAFGS